LDRSWGLQLTLFLFRRLILITIILSLFSPHPVFAKNSIKGMKCEKLGSKRISKEFEYTCIKSKKKLIWNSGVPFVVKPAPSNSPQSFNPNLPKYSIAEIAIHNSASSCWSIIEGGVYDLTSWIEKHPGGQSAIRLICGVDGTKSFIGKHGGGGAPNRELSQRLIGRLLQ